jgi:hypothetical protein
MKQKKNLPRRLASIRRSGQAGNKTSWDFLNIHPEASIPNQPALLILTAIILFYGICAMAYGQKVEKEIQDFKVPDSKNVALERKIFSLTEGYPIEKMIPLMSQKEKMVAAFMVSVAKKESDWGNHIPLLNGKNCYNYWGYRGQSDFMTSDGYTCFKNSRQAVNTVSRRFSELINESDLNTPQKMVVWKCGWDCAGDSQENVSKWISDVDYYFKKFY